QHTQVARCRGTGRGMRDELQVVRVGLDRDDAVARADFTAAVLQPQGRGMDIAGGDVGERADVDLRHLVAEELVAVTGDHIVLPQVAVARNGVAAGVQIVGRPGLGEAHGRADHRVALAGLCVLQAQYIGVLAGAGTQAVVFQADYVGQLLEAVHDGQVLQERLDVRQRNRPDRRFLARPRLRGDAVQVGQAQHVTRVDQVRILDLRVGLPDFRPQPRLLQETRRDVPQRVTLFHHVGVRVRVVHFHRDGVGRDGQQRHGGDRTELFQHGCDLPDSPTGWRTIVQKRGHQARTSGRIGTSCRIDAAYLITGTAMALLPILEFPDPRLRTKAALVDAAEVTTPAFQQLLDDMFQTMYEAPGIGLAASQVDVHKRFMVIDTSEERNAPMVFINPQIVSASEGGRVYQEGCLSVPGIYADVTRADSIVVRFLDRDGKQQELAVDDLLATCIQHEMDHLDGKLFIDYLSPLKREMVRKKLAKQRRHVA